MGELGKLSRDEIDRLIAGESLPPGSVHADLGKFVQDLKLAYAAKSDPQVETSHLSAIMDAVRSAAGDGQSLAPAAASSGTERLRIGRSARWRRVVLGNAGAALALKVLGGAAALAASAGGLAAVNALPDPVQRHVATAVEAVTPFELPGNRPAQPASGRGVLEVEEVPPAQIESPAPNPNAEFGQDVAEDAKQGGVSGPETSERAREKNRQPGQQPGSRGESHRPPGTGPAAPEQIPGPPQSKGPPEKGQDVTGAGPGNEPGQANGGVAGQAPAPQAAGRAASASGR